MEKTSQERGMKPDGVERSLHDEGGPSYKVSMPQSMWWDEPWNLEEFNNVQNKQQHQVTKCKQGKLVFGKG